VALTKMAPLCAAAAPGTGSGALVVNPQLFFFFTLKKVLEP